MSGQDGISGAAWQPPLGCCEHVLSDGTRIIVQYDPPPIPTWRQFAWSAITSEYEGGDPIGHGATEHEAIADLAMQLEDRQ